MRGLRHIVEKTGFALLVLCVPAAIAFHAHAQTAYPALPREGEGVKDWTPAPWALPKHSGKPARGDLNKDGIEDLAFVIEHPQTTSEKRDCGQYDSTARPRLLVVLFGRKGGGYKLALRDRWIIRRADEGGIMGDPFRGLRYERGTLLIDHQGGSRHRWQLLDRYRFQRSAGKRGLFRIGRTETTLDTATGAITVADTNYLTARQKSYSYREVVCRPCRQGEVCPRCGESQTEARAKAKWRTLKRAPFVQLGRAPVCPKKKG